jgi:predicted metal-dependent phosphoesterase TrpH
MCTVPVVKRICRESYSPPKEVYEKLKRAGMGLVTVTDHDSIHAVGCLGRYPDFFLSEEVTCRMPTGTVVHVGVYDINERQHGEIQRRRDDLLSLVAYRREQDLFFSVNHAFSCLTGRRRLADFELFERDFPCFEALNGHILPRNNFLAGQLARWGSKLMIAGSDGHTLRSAGSAFTEVPGARNREEFFRGLKRGEARLGGEAGSYWKLTRDVLLITANLLREKPLTALLLPFVLGIPAVTLAHHLLEIGFARRWGRRVARERWQQAGAADISQEAVA